MTPTQPENVTPEQLLPCPMCGRSDTPVVSPIEVECEECGAYTGVAEGFRVYCDASGDNKVGYKGGCGTGGGYSPTAQGAIEKWNRRAAANTIEQRDREIAELREANAELYRRNVAVRNAHTELHREVKSIRAQLAVSDRGTLR
jgi:FtsZ-binding cell division protein ZapB